jgi:hypothetical protein
VLRNRRPAVVALRGWTMAVVGWGRRAQPTKTSALATFVAGIVSRVVIVRAGRGPAVIAGRATAVALFRAVVEVGAGKRGRGLVVIWAR